MKLEHLDSTLFDWSKWHSGSPKDLGIPYCNYKDLMIRKEVVRKYAIGYCNGENLLCRPKFGTKAVMFFKDSITFWFHLTNKEFNEIFD